MGDTGFEGPVRGRIGRRGAISTGVTVGVALLVGCDSLLDVPTDPETVDPQEATTLESAMAGMESDFTLAYDIFVLMGGFFTDELLRTHTGCGGWDCRRVFPEDDGVHGVGDTRNETAQEPIYPRIQTAVAQADRVQAEIRDGVFEELGANATESEQYARASLLAGFSKFMVATLYCTVAFNGTGPELTSTQAYQVVGDELTEAIDAANASEAIRQAALVGRARVRWWLGDLQGALADARQVDPEFEFEVAYAASPVRQQNRVWFETWDHRTATVDEPFRFLTIDQTGNVDPRTAHSEALQAFSPQATVWAPTKVPSASSQLRVASGDEAQYIIAEIVGGQEAVTIINAVRQRKGIGVAWQPSGTGPTEIRDKVIDERKRTLFLDGLRMYDLRRYLENYDIDFFPKPPNPFGFLMGDQTCAPLPDVERNNNPDI